MPATEDVWRNLRTMHVVSAASAFALLATTLWMMQADYADEWRGIQRVAYEAQAQQIDDDLLELDTQEFADKEKELEQQVKAAKEAVAARQAEVDPASKEVDHLDGEFQRLSRELKFQNAKRDKVRADYDLKVRDGLTSKKELEPYREIFDTEQGKATEMDLKLQDLQLKFDTAKAKLADLTKPRDEALAAKKKYETELVRLEKAKEKIAPDPRTQTGVAFKRWLMQLPIIEGFNGPLKLNQIWLPDLT